MSGGNEVSEPLGGIGINLVVVGGHLSVSAALGGGRGLQMVQEFDMKSFGSEKPMVARVILPSSRSSVVADALAWRRPASLGPALSSRCEFTARLFTGPPRALMFWF